MEQILLNLIDLIYYENKLLKAVNKYEKCYYLGKILKIRKCLWQSIN